MERIIPYIIENKKCSKPPNREDWTQNPQEQTKSITELWKDVAQYISARPSLEWWAWIVIKLIKQDGSNSIQGLNLINDVAMEWFGTLAFTIITQKRDYNYSMTTWLQTHLFEEVPWKFIKVIARAIPILVGLHFHSKSSWLRALTLMSLMSPHIECCGKPNSKP